MKRFIAFALAGLSFGAGSGIAAPVATAQDVSPTLLIESMPNTDNPKYRRVVLVHYLQGERITMNFMAENRTEFKRVDIPASPELVAQCARGQATSLREIDQFERDEARRVKNGQAPERRVFCVKNVPNWEGGNRSRYLDPIFASMPYSVQGF